MEAAARGIGRTIGDTLPSGVGFCLMLFTFGGPGGWSTYLSNAQRPDMIAAIRELLDKLEAS
jgi:hypothetical protein